MGRFAGWSPVELTAQMRFVTTHRFRYGREGGESDAPCASAASLRPAAKTDAASKGALPQTGDPAAVVGVLAASAAALSGAGACALRRKNGIR